MDIQKKAMLTPTISRKVLRQRRKTSVRIVCDPVEIRSRHLPNTCHKHYRLSQLPGFKWCQSWNMRTDRTNITYAFYVYVTLFVQTMLCKQVLHELLRFQWARTPTSNRKTEAGKQWSRGHNWYKPRSTTAFTKPMVVTCGDVHVHQVGSNPVVLTVGWDFIIPFARPPLYWPKPDTHASSSCVAGVRQV
jgi:hypothetical protein